MSCFLGLYTNLDKTLIFGLCFVLLQNKDQTSITIPKQIDVNITKQQHELETPIAKKKSKSPNSLIPIINGNIDTPILKNTRNNPSILEISKTSKN